MTVPVADYRQIATELVLSLTNKYKVIYASDVLVDRITTLLQSTAKSAREDERERWMRVVDVCTCGSSPVFRPVNQRHHAPTCSKHLATMVLAAADQLDAGEVN